MTLRIPIALFEVQGILYDVSERMELPSDGILITKYGALRCYKLV